MSRVESGVGGDEMGRSRNDEVGKDRASRENGDDIRSEGVGVGV